MQLSTLSQVLVPLLLDEQISDIFTRVAETFSLVLAKAFRALEPTPGLSDAGKRRWHDQWRINIVYLLDCLKGMPLADDAKDSCLKELLALCSGEDGGNVVEL